MFLKALRLRNFRNYAHLDVSFSPHINIICGGNAQGKTNLLEAIYLLSTGRSFRTTHLSDLIKEGQSFFLIEATIYRDEVLQTIQLYFDKTQKKMKVNRSSYSTFSPLLGLFPSVLYAPDDSEFISGSPSLRRRFLNLHIAQYDPLYVHHLTRFWKAMKYRNHLLKKRSLDSIECWENEMAISSNYLVDKRQKTLKEIFPFLIDFMSDLSQKKETIHIEYVPSVSSSTSTYLKLLEKSRKKDMDYKNTSIGPHRDDFYIQIDQKSARSFASEGQKRTAAIALRLAEYKRLSSLTQERVVFHIDDLGMHLDPIRQKLLFSYLKNLAQVFITTPHPQEKWEEGSVFFIEKGNVFDKIDF